VRVPSVPQRTEFIAFEEGADFVTPALRLKSGFARDAQNFEIDVNGGYRRIKGYERYDGQPAPSSANYAVLTVALTTAATLGETVTGGTSSATGVVVAVAANQLILTKTSGTFGSETITGSVTAAGTCTGPAIVDGAGTSVLAAQYKNVAADEYRSDIAAVPGSGAVLGVWVFDDVRYAFRNNAGGTAVDMYKATSSGWGQVALGRELSFTSGGTYEIQEGDTIEGATSGATAVVTRVVLETGSWAGGTAAGRLIFASQTGTFQSENLDVGASTNVATIAGNSSAITFAVPGGRFEFVNYNFSGATDTRRMYGCDGKNRAFEFDGTVFVPIDSGMDADAPTHITVHKNQLFLSFLASIQHSAPGQPYVFNPILGTSTEIAMGDDVTGFKVQPGGQGGAALAIFTRNNTAILYGSDTSDWNLVQFNEEAGAYAHSIQHVGFTMMLDDRGVTSLATSQNFGNFASATLSKLVQSWVNTRRSTVTASCIVRDKNQYRLFFSDGSALFVTIDNAQVLGMMPMLFPDAVRCACSAELSDGNEVIYFGAADGFVYQMEKGTSFDGDAIEAFLEMAFNASGNHRQQKRYRACTLEIAGEGYAEVAFTYELGYGVTTIEQPGSQTLNAPLSSVRWDAFTWDAFVWDGVTLQPSEADMVGTAENVSIILRSNADYFESFLISGATLTYSPRRMLRANN
jgi:hypothetical protein